MENLPQLRKNIKFFAGGKNQPLVDLSSMVFDGEKVVSVEAIESPKENNTLLKLVRDMYPMAGVENPFNVTNDDRFKYRSIAYNRMSVEEALRLAFNRSEAGNFVIEASLPHPISDEDVIKLLNNSYGFDMSEDDITVTHTGSNRYTLTAKPNSLCFYGSAGTEIGQEGTDPEPDIPSHDALIVTAGEEVLNASAAWVLGNPITVNGNAVAHDDMIAMDAAGLINFQYAPIESPTAANWTILTATVETNVKGTLTAVGNVASEHNINETIKITGVNAEFKLVPFVRETTKPVDSEVYPEFVGGVEFDFMANLAAIYDKMFAIWVDNTPTRLVDIANGTVPGLILLNGPNGVARITSTDNAPHNIVMQGHIATLPALLDDYWRILEPRTVGEVAAPVQPLDARNRELYFIRVMPEVQPQPEDSTVTPVIIQTQPEFVAIMDKLGISVTLLPWNTYRGQVYSITSEGHTHNFGAHLDTLTFPNLFPFTYFIDSDAWAKITAQASEAYLGSLVITPVEGVVTTVDITPAYLQARAVNTTGGVLIGLRLDLPANAEMLFNLDWDLLGNDYAATVTTINVKIDHTKPSLIAPAHMSEALLRQLYPMEQEEWYETQLSIERVIVPNNGKYAVEFKMPPGSSEVPS